MDPTYGANFYFGSCTRCDEAVYSAGGACRAMGHLFHDTCFTCCVCNKKLTGKAFYSVSGEIYCEDDFLYSGVHLSPDVCNSCGFLIMDKLLQACGKSYHPSCFRCVVCRRSLEDLPFTVDSHSRVYCVSDYHRLRASYCAACRTQILQTEGCSESVRVVSFDRNYHVQCYRGEGNLTRTGAD